MSTPAPVRQAVALLELPWRRLAAAALLGTATVLSATALLGVSAWLVVKAGERPPVDTLVLAAVLVRALGIGRGVFRYLERLVSHDVALRGVVDLRARAYERLAAAPTARVAGLRRGDLLARLGADLDTLADVVVRAVLPAAVAVGTSLVAVAAVAVIHPPAALPLLAGLVVSGVAAPMLAALAARRREGRAAEVTAEISAATLATLDAAAELRVAGLATARRRDLAALDGELATARRGADRAAGWAAALQVAGLGVAVVGAALITVPAIASGALTATLGAVVLFVPLAALEATATLPAAAALWVRARVAADRIVDLAGPGPAESGDGTAGHEEAGTEKAGRKESGPEESGRDAVPAVLRADRITAGWPGRPAAVRDAGLVLDATTRTVAVVGPSGAGKSTLLAALAGLLPPRSGTVRVSGLDPAVVGDDTRRRLVHLVGEADHVFATSVRENLRLADPEASEDRLVRALVDAGLGGWLTTLPRGLDTVVGSAGSDVSGGERRRLLLARALLSPADVLLVDEPAEHLDPATADAIVTDLLSGNRPVVVAGHRLAPLVLADEVLVLRDGLVADRGPLAELLERDDELARAWHAEGGGVTPMAATIGGPA